MIIFFIPYIVTALVDLISKDNIIKECWNTNNNINHTKPITNNKNKDKQKITNDENSYEKGIQIQNKAKMSYNGVSDTKLESSYFDHYKITFDKTTYEVYGQNENSFASEYLRDGRTFSNGGCGPTTLTSALSGYGYKGDPVEVNQAGSDVSVESHEKAIKELQKQGKLAKTVKVKSHPKSSLPSTADLYYSELKESLEKNRSVVIDLREARKINNNFCDVFDNGGPHAHWVTLIGYDPSNDKTFVANSCGRRDWFELKRLTNSTFEAVNAPCCETSPPPDDVLCSDECGWVGSWIEIYEK